MARVGSSPIRLLERTADGVLLYGVTPPRLTTAAERADEIAGATLAVDLARDVRDLLR